MVPKQEELRQVPGDVQGQTRELYARYRDSCNVAQAETKGKSHT